MIWPSRICSRYKAAGAFRYWPAWLILAAALQAGSVHGRVEIVSSQDPEVRKHSDYSGVVVWLEPASGAPPAPLPPHRKVEMVQKGKKFTPRSFTTRSQTTTVRSSMSACIRPAPREP